MNNTKDIEKGILWAVITVCCLPFVGIIGYAIYQFGIVPPIEVVIAMVCVVCALVIIYWLSILERL